MSSTASAVSDEVKSVSGSRKDYPIDVVDSIRIRAPKELVFKVISDYGRMHEWAVPGYRCEWQGGASVATPGAEVRHTYRKGPFLLTDFVRTIDVVVPNERLEETYARGSNVGKGVWQLSEQNGITTAAFDCKVDATSALNKLIFRTVGNSAHSTVYAKILKNLKAHCEALAANQQKPACCA